MTKDQMNDLLADIISMYAAPHGRMAAKEGLIKQHTAEKAIAIFKSALLSSGDSCTHSV